MGSFVDFQGLSGHGKSPHSAGQCLVELLCAGRAFDPVAKKKAKQANAIRGNAEDAWALAVQALIEDMPVASCQSQSHHQNIYLQSLGARSYGPLPVLSQLSPYGMITDNPIYNHL